MVGVRTKAVLLVCALGLAWGAPAEADLKEIKKSRVLRVVVSFDELPHMFSFEESGDPGLEREMLEAFARSKKLKLEIVRAQRFEDVIPTLLVGAGDVVTGMIATPARREKIAFTVETLPARHVAVNRTPAPPVDSVAALSSLRVGTVAGSSWTGAALEAGVPQARLVELEGAQRVLLALKDGEVDAVVMSVTDFSQAQRDDDQLQAGVFVGSASSAAWGLRKEDTDLKKTLDEFLGSLLSSPTWSRMVLKYFSKEGLELMARGRK